MITLGTALDAAAALLFATIAWFSLKAVFSVVLRVIWVLQQKPEDLVTEPLDSVPDFEDDIPTSQVKSIPENTNG